MKTLFIALVSLVPFAVESPKIPEIDYAKKCLTANVFFESRGESIKGMQAVAKVTMNRVSSRKYPSDVCSVVFQRKQFSWTFQQPWQNVYNVLHGNISPKDRRGYQLAEKTAEKAFKNSLEVSKLEHSTHYHAKSVKPKWSEKFKQVKIIGNHIFYKE